MRSEVDCGSYAAQLQDAVRVALVLLHLLPEADGLFHLVGVHIFGPPPLHVVDPTAFGLEALRVHLDIENVSGHTASSLDLTSPLQFGQISTEYLFDDSLTPDLLYLFTL